MFCRGWACGEQRPGPNVGPSVQLHVPWGIGQAQGERARGLLRPGATNQQEDSGQAGQGQAKQDPLQCLVKEATAKK